MNQETLLQRHTAQEPQQLTTKEIKIGENIKFMLAIAFLLALIGAAIDILV